MRPVKKTSFKGQQSSKYRRLQTIKDKRMYAIVEIAGQQFKVEKDRTIFVHRLQTAEGEQVEFEKVLLIEDGKDIKVGTPTVSGAKITAKVLSHMRGDKVKVFKKKRRQGYQKLNGHRQDLTQIQIENISF